jgi:hypothetical protein
MDKEAVNDKVDGTNMGIRTNLVMIKLNKRVPNILPMFGQKATVSYDGSSKICKNCYDYRKKDLNCEKRS